MNYILQSVLLACLVTFVLRIAVTTSQIIVTEVVWQDGKEKFVRMVKHFWFQNALFNKKNTLYNQNSKEFAVVPEFCYISLFFFFHRFCQNINIFVKILLNRPFKKINVLIVFKRRHRHSKKMKIGSTYLSMFNFCFLSCQKVFKTFSILHYFFNSILLRC